MYFFHVLILKIVVIYSKPSLIIAVRKSKCMCMLYNIINPWIEIYECFNEFINLCTCLLMHNVFLFLYDIKYKTFEGYDHG